MAHKSPLRSDKTCLNCNYVVDQRFCPNCGQENTDTRKTFHHLFVHFFEDLTHYENAFWKTIKNLLLKPASLTTEYLSGKRLSYLAPVRLYIFISFVTFFTLAVLPDDKDDKNNKNYKENQTSKSDENQFSNDADSVKYEAKKELATHDSVSQKENLNREALRIEELKNQGILEPTVADSIKKFIELGKKEKDPSKNNDYLFDSEYETVAQLDSVRKAYPRSMSGVEYWFDKKTIELKEKYTSDQLKEKFMEYIKRNFPKTLFFYMPLFAFMLWLFHNKKKWYYFDHGIFTLHYFSFLLLITLITTLIETLLSFLGDNKVLNLIESIVTVVGTLWMLYYFFPAHHRFYGETRMVSFIKSIFLFVINSVLFAIVLTLFVIYTFANL